MLFRSVKSDLVGVKNDLTGVKNDITGVQKDLRGVKRDIQGIKETVNRIEIFQTDYIIGMLNENKKKSDFEIDYLNDRLNTMEKRIFNLEKNSQN